MVLNTIKQTIYLRLLAMSHTFYAIYVGCSIFQTAKLEQTITHRHVLLRLEGLIGEL